MISFREWRRPVVLLDATRTSTSLPFCYPFAVLAVDSLSTLLARSSSVDGRDEALFRCTVHTIYYCMYVARTVPFT